VLLGAPTLRAAADEQRAILTLIVNQGKHAEATVVLRGDEIWVPEGDLTRAGLVNARGRSEIIGGLRHLLLSSITPALEVSLDERSLALRIDAPTSALGASVINFRPTAPANLVHRGDTSVFLNYAARVIDVEKVGFSGEAGVSVAGALLATGVTATPKNVIRGLSALTLDHPSEMVRLTLGDAMVSGGPLGGGFFSGGVTISKNFALDPYFISHPSFGYATSALTPSTLEVYVDGVLVRSQPVPPGMVRLDNVPVPSGSGEVRYVVRDAFGREQTTSSPYFTSAALLGKGISDYTYSVGAQRNGFGTKSFDYGKLSFLGTQRYGVTQHLTAGGRLEASADVLSAGATISTILPVGQLDLGVAGSTSHARLGGAAFAAFFFSTRSFGASGSVRLASDAYSTLGLAPEDRRDLVELNASTSVQVARGVSLATRYAFALDRDKGATFQLGVSTSVQVAKRVSLMLSAGRSTHTDGSAPIDLFATLSCSLGNGMMGSAGARYQNGKPAGLVDLSSPLPRGDGAGFRATALLGEQPQGQGTAMLNTSFGRYQATGAFSSDGPHLSLEGAGALVAVSGAGLFASRPVQEGFAVIQVPGAKGVRAMIDNHEVGRTDDEGNVLIPDLLPFYGNRLAINDSDLPLDYTVGVTEQVIAPPFRGGALVRFEAYRTRFLRGTLVVVNAAKKQIIPAYGELSVRTDKAELGSPIAADGAFELEGLATGSYPATIRFNGKECDFTLDIPDRSSSIIELGKISCTGLNKPSTGAPERR
jgi:outer membrane usher protein